jgi:hypothetical protein
MRINSSGFAAFAQDSNGREFANGNANDVVVNFVCRGGKCIFRRPPEDKPQFVNSGGMLTASWSHDGKAYLMVGHGDMAAWGMIFVPKSAIKRQLPIGFSLKLASNSNFQKNYLE